MSKKRAMLSNARFGSRIAEEEAENLHDYFVETEQWRKVFSGEVDIIFGAKGAGKSALYSLLVGKKEELRLGRRTVFIPAENPRGATAFSGLTTEPALPEDGFRGLWKLYFLTLAANYLRFQITATKTKNENANEVIKVLTDCDLLPTNVNLLTRLKTAYDYFRQYLPHIEGTVKDPNSGFEFKGKITLGEPNKEQRGLGFRSLDSLLSQLNESLAEQKITCWLVLDRLDVAFIDSQDLEANALRALFRAYLDMIALSNLKVKIFLRDDIWKRIVGPGFREASHITKTLTLSWDKQSLLNLIVKRIASNIDICDYYGCDRDRLMSDAELQKEFFYKFFPEQVDVGKRQPETFDWMMSRTADGSKRTAPRELIHLLLETRDQQLLRYQVGNNEPENDRSIDNVAIRAAMPAVSSARYNQTLCAEYPMFKDNLDALEGEKTQQSLESLAALWRCNRAKAETIAEKLFEVGFFERRGAKDSPTYWVPFLYRDALKMVQGAAD